MPSVQPNLAQVQAAEPIVAPQQEEVFMDAFSNGSSLKYEAESLHKTSMYDRLH